MHRTSWDIESIHTERHTISYTREISYLNWGTLLNRHAPPCFLTCYIFKILGMMLEIRFSLIKMVKIYLLFIKNMLNINVHHINYCFNIALPLFIHINLVHINTNIGIFIFLNVAPSQNLVFVRDGPVRINTAYLCMVYIVIYGTIHTKQLAALPESLTRLGSMANIAASDTRYLLQYATRAWCENILSFVLISLNFSHLVCHDCYDVQI